MGMLVIVLLHFLFLRKWVGAFITSCADAVDCATELFMVTAAIAFIEMSVLLPAEAKDDLLPGALVSRHKAGSGNAVSADQFGEQTTIKVGKCGPKGITVSSTQVAKWIDSFPISAYVYDTLDHCYSPDLSSSETPHKEEGVKRCKIDEADHQGISTKLGKLSHPFDTESSVLYNIHNGHVATIYMFVFLFKWRSGMVLSLVSTPHVPT